MKKIKRIWQPLLMVIFLFLALIFIWTRPFDYVNISLQANFGNIPDGTNVVLQVSNGENHYTTIGETIAYSNRAAINFNPDYYAADGLRLVVSEKQSVHLDNIEIKSGNYSATDKKIGIIEIKGLESSETDSGTAWTFTSETHDQLLDIIHSNQVIKWILSVIAVLIIGVITFSLPPLKSKPYGRLLRRIFGGITIVIAVMIAIYPLLSHNIKELEVLNNDNHSEENITTKRVYNMAEQSFIADDNKIDEVRIYLSDAPISDVNYVGVRLIESTSRQELASAVQDIEAIQNNGMIVLDVDQNTIQLSEGESYTVEFSVFGNSQANNVESYSENNDENDKGNQSGIPLVIGKEFSQNRETIVPMIDGEAIDGNIHLGVVYYQKSATVEAYTIIACLVALIFLTVAYKKLHLKTKYVVGVVYILMFCYAVYQVGYYMFNVGYTPDESMHIAYIAHLVLTNEIIPDFTQMHGIQGENTAQLLTALNGQFESIITVFFNDGTNYLGHPPLYYHIMRLAGAVQIVDDGIQVDPMRLRMFSACIGLFAILFCYYIGYTRIDKEKPLFHLFYATIVISVPMSLYNLSGVNNDTLSLLGCSAFLLGLLRFCENRKNYLTYLLIALGMVTTLLSKTSAGLILAIMSVLFILYDCFKNKNIKDILCKEFIVTLPIYVIAVAYFVYIYVHYGTFQLEYANIDYGEYLHSGFYTPFDNRTRMGIFEYIQYYWSNFWGTWTGVHSHVGIGKDGAWLNWDRLCTILLLFVPIYFFFIKKERKYTVAFRCFFIALAATMSVQFIRAYELFFFKSGYLGSFQSRYYLCIIPFLAFSAVYLLQMLCKEKDKAFNELRMERSKDVSIISRLLMILVAILTIILNYSSFIYFIVNYVQTNVYLL